MHRVFGEDHVLDVATTRLLKRVVLPPLAGEKVTAASIEADLGPSAGG